jgi:hypothetical protein
MPGATARGIGASCPAKSEKCDFCFPSFFKHEAHLVEKAGLRGGGRLHGQVLLWGKTACSTDEVMKDRRIRSSRF